MKRLLTVLFMALPAFGCSSSIVEEPTAEHQPRFKHPVIKKPLAQVGSDGNDDLIAPFGIEGQQDLVYGLDGRDEIYGHIGYDELYGGNGNDEILGDYGPDYIVGGQGWDYLSGNAHADIIEAADGRKDTVLCGKGDADRATVDKVDKVEGCEFVSGAAK
jgi:Ca2+-binding RTX toxin-like protein